MTDPITLDDIANVVRLLAITTKDQEVRPHPASNLIQHSLLHQLRTNIVPDGDGAGGRRKAANERMLINVAAFSLYEYLVSAIATLFEQGTDRRPTGTPEEQLVAWYVELAVQASDGEVTQAQYDNLYARVDEWRTRIMDHFRPPEREEIPEACPECGWKVVTRETADGDVRQYALVCIERPWRDEEGVRCRNCNTTWIGKEAVTELAADLGIDVAKALAPKPTPPKPVEDNEPLWLCSMAHDQANQYARTREIDPKRIVLASGPITRLRGTTRPIRFVVSENYDPGPREAARVQEAIRVARVVNQLNGYDPDGNTIQGGDPA